MDSPATISLVQPPAKEEYSLSKQHILDEIKRTTRENGGVPLGKTRFFQETGIRDADWFGKYWVRWSDALREAGFTPNTLQEPYNEEMLIKKYIGLVRELGHIPVKGELRLKRHNDTSFPSDKVFQNRFGSKDQLISKIAEYSRNRTGLEDIVQLCTGIPSTEEHTDDEKVKPVTDGCVYLLKVGRHYKIGKTNAIGRREYELAIQLPQRARTIHVIQTDDPCGIEAYWHMRFATKRTNGE